MYDMNVLIERDERLRVYESMVSLLRVGIC